MTVEPATTHDPAAACFMCGGTGRCQPHNDYCYGPDGGHPATCDDRCKFCQPAHDRE